MAKKCNIRGGTKEEAIKAIVEVGCGGWCCYECWCGQWHIIGMPKEIK